jgi:hypothetical protein
MYKKIISLAMIVALLLVAVATVAFGEHTTKSYSYSAFVPPAKTYASGTQSGTCKEGDAIHYKTTVKLTFTDGITTSSTQNSSYASVLVPTGKTGYEVNCEFQARCQYNYEKGDMYGNISAGMKKASAKF